MRNEAETHLLDTPAPPPAPRAREQRLTVCDTGLCSEGEIVRTQNVIWGFQLNFTQSGQSLCHHIIYHILWVVEMGGSVKITSPRVVILS